MTTAPGISERAYWVAWSQVHGVGPVTLKRLHSHFGSLGAAWRAEVNQVLEVEGIGLSLGASLTDYRQRVCPAELLAAQERRHPNFWTPADPEYPGLLFEIADPPPVLYYRGRPELALALQTLPSVAIVGTRTPSDYGQRWTRRLVHQLVAQDVVIVSGLASGIDREAHSQTLEGGGLTIAVVGTGVDQAYPWSNRHLQQRIAQQGLLLSEYENGTPPDRVHFPRRNRIIAGLSRIVAVTEAPLRSGALITARLANDYGREVFALPGCLDNPSSLGCLDLIRQGAQLIMDDTTLVQELGKIPQLAPPDAVQSATVDPVTSLPLFSVASIGADLQQVLGEIGPVPMTVDQIALKVEKTTSELLSSLAQLELMGLITLLPGMRYQRR
ncbi:MAG: DNA-processing protein DprA [Nodosilinea sp.]